MWEFLRSRLSRTRRLLLTRLQYLEFDEIDPIAFHTPQFIFRDRVEGVSSTIAEGDHVLLLDDLLDRDDGALNWQVLEWNHVRLVVDLGLFVDDSFALDLLTVGQHTAHGILWFLLLKVGNIFCAARSVTPGA